MAAKDLKPLRVETKNKKLNIKIRLSQGNWLLKEELNFKQFLRNISTQNYQEI